MAVKPCDFDNIYTAIITIVANHFYYARHFNKIAYVQILERRKTVCARYSVVQRSVVKVRRYVLATVNRVMKTRRIKVCRIKDCIKQLCKLNPFCSLFAVVNY